jgi:hypothetical protein
VVRVLSHFSLATMTSDLLPLATKGVAQHRLFRYSVLLHLWSCQFCCLVLFHSRPCAQSAQAFSSPISANNLVLYNIHSQHNAKASSPTTTTLPPSELHLNGSKASKGARRALHAVEPYTQSMCLVRPPCYKILRTCWHSWSGMPL